MPSIQVPQPDKINPFKSSPKKDAIITLDQLINGKNPPNFYFDSDYFQTQKPETSSQSPRQGIFSQPQSPIQHQTTNSQSIQQATNPSSFSQTNQQFSG